MDLLLKKMITFPFGLLRATAFNGSNHVTNFWYFHLPRASVEPCNEIRPFPLELRENVGSTFLVSNVSYSNDRTVVVICDLPGSRSRCLCIILVLFSILALEVSDIRTYTWFRSRTATASMDILSALRQSCLIVTLCSELTVR